MKRTIILSIASLLAFQALAQQPLDTLRMDEIRRSPVLSIDEAIAGRIAGVNVYFSDDAPGRLASYSLRGIEISNPLFVIDGVIADQAFAHSINPAQVESIVVLTDIAATSKYGSQGLGGVVEIALKKGNDGRPVVDFDAFCGANIFSKSSLAGTSYESEAMRPALLQSYNVAVSGGSSAAGNRFYANIGYISEGGVLLATSNDRFQGDFRYEQSLTRKVSFHLGVAYRSDRQSGIATDQPYADYMVAGGVASPYDQPDSYIMYYVAGPGASAVSTLENAYSKVIRANVTGEFGLNWKIVRGLEFKALASYNAATIDDQKFNNKKTLFGDPNSIYGMNINSSAVANKQNRYGAEAKLDYAHSFESGSAVSATAGFFYGGEDYGFRGQRSYNMTTEALGTAALNTGTYLPVPIFDASYSNMRVYSRAMYSCHGLYEVFAGISADAFNGAQKEKWNILPTAGAAWNFGRADFAEGSPLSSGRLCASVGRTGNTLPVLSGTGVTFDRLIATQADASVSAGFWEEMLSAKLGTYFIALDGGNYSGVELSAKGYPVKSESLNWNVYANTTFAFGNNAGCWGGAGTCVDWNAFDFSANLLFNPLYARCANITAGYTLGRDVLKMCGMRLFVNAGNLLHGALYKNFDFSTDPAKKYPGSFSLTAGVSVQL